MRWWFILAFLSALTADAVGAITRGPYLQSGSTHSVIVRWRTDNVTDSQVRLGTTPNNLALTAGDPTLTSEHIVLVDGLAPDTRYYYSVGSSGQTLAQGASYFFLTAPLQGKPTRIWVLGDSGTAGVQAAAVRDAYQTLTGGHHTDLWLMLGDNAYESGFDDEYQAAVFEMYPEMLRKSVLWPTIGNHDAPSTPIDFPFLHIFSLPTEGEAGGVPSGSERYHSFDYGNIHFVCLDSMTVDRGSNGPMCNWLREDLAANTKDWLIAYWHHPPYSRGSHNSDIEGELVEMRQNAVPILEEYGVDLVMAGHSHSYERSYLLDGHYGTSATLQPHMIKDFSGGRPCETGGYYKPPGTPRAGVVYAVAGSSGQVSGSSRHPAMFMHLSTLGSLVLDIDGDVLVARFLESTGRIADEFSIIKGTRQEPCLDPDGGRMPDIVWKTNGHTAPVRHVAFAPGGTTLASSGEDGRIRLWSITNGTVLGEWRADQGATDQVLFLPNATYLLSSGTDGQIKYWQTSPPMVDRTLEANFTFQAELPLAYSAVADRLASSASIWHPFGIWLPGYVNLWRASDGTHLQTLAANHGWGLDFSPDGAQLISAARDGTVLRWRVADGNPMGSLPAGVTKVLKYSPDGTLIATGGDDRHVKLWRASDGALVRTLTGHNDAISALAFTPNGTMLVTAGQFDSTLRFWRVADGQLMRTYYRECYAVNSIAFTSDGQLFAYGRRDNGVVLARNPFPPLGLTVSDAAMVEGGSAQFTVRLPTASAQVVSVTFATQSGSAASGVDFVHTNGVAAFVPGQTHRTITVASLSDAFRETNEFFRVVLSNPINAAIAAGQATGVILDDDPLPTLACADVASAESTAALAFNLTLSSPTHQSVTLDYFTDNETALAGNDYEARTGSVRFAPGETNKTIIVNVLDDTAGEATERFEVHFINLKNAAAATPAAFGWITDDDAAPGQLSRFEWNVIGASQLVNQPFPVTVRAKDFHGDPVTSFTGSANLAGVKPPTVLFRDDFEDGTITDWTQRAAAYVRVVTNDTAATGTRSLTVIGGGRYRLDGVAHPLGGIQPGRINFQVRSVNALKSAAYLVASTNDSLQGAAICFRMDGTNGMGLEEGGRFHGVPFGGHRWYKVSLVLDWTARRMAYYVDGQLVAPAIPFCNPAASRLNVVHLYNFDNTQSWWDDLEFLQEPEPVPIAIIPATTGDFANGVWSGEVTIQQPGANMYLLAEAAGRTGASDIFSAIAFPPVILQPPVPQSVVAGGNVTFSVLMSGTLPMRYEWRRVQAPLYTNLFVLNDHLSFFTLTNVPPNFAGNYLLTVRNPAPNGVAASFFTLNLLADSDADGLPDAWETAYNLDDATADADGDGLSSRAEYEAGTVPINAASVLRLAWSGLQLQFEASSNKTYTVQHAPTLGETNWGRFTDIAARATNHVQLLTNTLPSGFYRLVTPRMP